MDKIKELLNESIKKIGEEGITTENIDTLKTLVDIKKDIADEEYKKEAINMKYRNYDDDFGARRRDSRGRFMNRGYDDRNMNPNRMPRGFGNHRPEEYFERMYDGYDEYMNGMMEYNRGGNYGAKDKGLESLEYTLENFVCFLEYMQENADSPEEMEIIKKYARKIKDM